MPAALCTPFGELAAALTEQARYERLRLLNNERLFACQHARGLVEPDPSRGLAGQRWRVERLEEATELLARLAPHEAPVRALDPDLAVPVDLPTACAVKLT